MVYGENWIFEAALGTVVVLAENAMLQVEKRRSMTGKAPAVESANFGFLARHDVQLVRLGALAEAVPAITRTPPSSCSVGTDDRPTSQSSTCVAKGRGGEATTTTVRKRTKKRAAQEVRNMMQETAETTIEPGDFVELRGRPWLVEELRGDANNLRDSQPVVHLR